MSIGGVLKLISYGGMAYVIDFFYKVCCYSIGLTAAEPLVP